jgi:hypothetical protein
MTDFSRYYPDNINIQMDDTIIVRGNSVSDITGSHAIGINLHDIKNLRAKNNKAVRIRSPLNDAKGFEIAAIEDAYLVYNTASRVDTGFDFYALEKLDVFNMTAHNCATCASVAATGNFTNIAFSAYQDTPLYRAAKGFVVDPSYSINIDYVFHTGLDELVDGDVVQGLTVEEKQILYIDEPNDDLTPDYISELVNAGTANPIKDENVDIGGIESPVTDEATAQRNYWFGLLDNSFWNIENPQAAEVSFIKAFQSRVLANTDVTISKVFDDIYIKTAQSVERFSELYPMYARYANTTKFKKRVMDMWFSGQNPARVQSYQNGIGGYNLLPSFFKRMEDYEDGWIIGVSYIAHDNWLNSMEDLKYGIGIDVLGTATMNQATSGECYNNVMSCLADIAPVRWFLHDQVQPSGYLMFTDMYNSFEDCQLENMHYNDDFNISIRELGQDGKITTPLLKTSTVMPSGGPSGFVEVSLLDRLYSENSTRELYYRQGINSTNMSAWEEITDYIGGVLPIDQPYVQFELKIENVIREIDYEFQGIGLRQYSSERDWTRPQGYAETFVELEAGTAAVSKIAPPLDFDTTLEFKADGVQHTCTWAPYIPKLLRTTMSKIRLNFATPGLAFNGTSRVSIVLYLIPETYVLGAPIIADTYTIQFHKNTITYLDLDILTMDANTELVYLMLARDSSDPLDTLASSWLFLNGRSI